MKNLVVLLAALGALVLRADPLTLTRTIPLPGMTGKLDHSTVDRAGQRLFVSAWAQNAVVVVDLRAGKMLRTLDGMAAPQGVLYVPELGRLYVANEKDGTLRVLDGTTFAPIASLALGDDADNIRYDAAAGRLYVGYEDGVLGVIDARRNTLIEKIPLAAHPEAFAVAPGAGRIVLNTPRSHDVTICARDTGRVIARWPLGALEDNFTLALDEADGRAFVGTRRPPFLLVLDLATGREIARLPLHGNTDDFHYDAKRKRIYASCGEGFIDVFAQTDADHYTLEAAVPTAAGGRTSAFDGDTIYLNVQSGAGQAPEVRCYAAKSRAGL